MPIKVPSARIWVTIVLPPGSAPAPPRSRCRGTMPTRLKPTCLHNYSRDTIVSVPHGTAARGDCRYSLLASDTEQGAMNTSIALAYRRKAINCLAVASLSPGQFVRSELLDLASEWFRLAEEAETERRRGLPDEGPQGNHALAAHRCARSWR
jgi:hypothetical protein